MLTEKLPLITALLDLLYPPCCQACGVLSDERPLCAACEAAIVPPPRPYCAACGAPVESASDLCEHCRAARPTFTWSHSAGVYDGALRRAVHRLKYHGRTALARPLGRALARSIGAEGEPLLRALDAAGARQTGNDTPLLVVPVPLHRSRLRQRGFNQAELIARALAEEFHWRLDTGCLVRTRKTASQTTYDPELRSANVRDAFAVVHPDRVAGKAILLVDDVLTTSATARECAGALRQAGAAVVAVAAVARSVKQRS